MSIKRKLLKYIILKVLQVLSGVVVMHTASPVTQKVEADESLQI